MLPATELPSASPRLAPPCQVLLVDRQTLFLAAVAGLLTGAPLAAEVTTVTRSDIDLRRARFDLLICEVRSEPIPGQELARLAVQLLPPPRVILLGDLEDAPALIAAIGVVASAVFTKDATPEEFIAGIVTVLAGRQVLGSRLSELLASRRSGTDARSRLAEQGRLSQTEQQVLALLGGGLSARQIAAARSISQKTVRNHLSSIYRKLGLRSRTEAMLVAARLERAAPYHS